MQFDSTPEINLAAFGDNFSKLGLAELGGLDIFEPLPAFGQMRKSRLDRPAVLSRDTCDLGQAGFDLLEPLRRKLEVLQKVPGGETEVFYDGPGRDHLLEVLGEPRVVLGKLRDLFRRFIESCQRRLVALIEQGIRVLAER